MSLSKPQPLPSFGPAYACFNRAPGRERSPRRFGNHADAIRQLHGFDDALDGRDLGLVEFLGLGAFDRRPQHRAVKHARHLHVDRILRAAVDLARQFGAHHVFGDEAELRGLLQVLRLDLRGLRGHFGEGRDLAVAELAVRLGVHHDARLGGKFGDRHAEFLRGVVQQHAANLRAKDPQILVVARHRVRTGGVHHPAKARIAVDLLVHRRGHDAHLAPVGIELFRDDQRQRGHRPLPHLGRRPT